MLQQVKVLIIDDQPDQLLTLQTALQEAHCQIEIATNGKAGRKTARQFQPHLVLLDVQMPGADGFATCRYFAADPELAHIPVIFLTVANSSGERLKGFESGAVDYVDKTCHPAEIIARIRVHLRHAAVEASAPMALNENQVLLKAAMHYIRQHLAQLPSLVEIAHTLGTHDKKLSLIFREKMQTTVFAWVREERIRVSKLWLASTDMPLAEIATKAGFSSPANFSSAFSKRVGVTPGQYRQSMQQSTGE